MSGLRETLEAHMKSAIKTRDQLKLDTLRMVVSAVKNKEIEKKGALDDDAVSGIIATLVKQRREAAELYRKGGREDLAEKEESEIALLKEYLPEELSVSQLQEIIEGVVDKLQVASPAQMGQVMKAVMAQIAGRADGKIVSQLVQQRLTKK